MPGNRHRNMYYTTGQPGFVRFGYSPGWAGRGASGLGPCAELLRTSQRPIVQAPAEPVAPAAGEAAPTREQAVNVLEAQARALQKQLDTLNQLIGELAEPQL